MTLWPYSSSSLQAVGRLLLALAITRYLRAEVDLNHVDLPLVCCCFCSTKLFKEHIFHRLSQLSCIFTAWRYVTLAVGQCPFVCRSDALMYTAKVSLNFFSPRQLHSSAFWAQAPLLSFKGNPFAGALNEGLGGENSHSMSLYLRNGIG